MERITRISYESGQRQQQEKYLEVQIKPGWKNGTKITFHKEGDQTGPGGERGMRKNTNREMKRRLTFSDINNFR